MPSKINDLWYSFKEGLVKEVNEEFKRQRIKKLYKKQTLR